MIEILVVDNENSVRKILREFFEREGLYKVFLAENGDKALEIIKDNSIDIVFLDVQIPGRDGVEIFRRIKEIKPEIKTIILTCLRDEYIFDRSVSVLEAVDGFLTKPLNLPELRKCFEAVISGGRHIGVFLNPLQLDALGKFASQSLKTLSHALSDILQKDAEMTLRAVNVIPLFQIKCAEKEKLSSASLVSRFKGGINGILMFMLSFKDGLILIDCLKNVACGNERAFNVDEQVLFKSLGTVLSGAFLKTLSNRVKLPAQINLPELVFEHRSLLIKSLSKELNLSWETEDEYCFTIDIDLSIAEPAINCRFSLIPDMDSLRLIFRALDILK